MMTERERILAVYRGERPDVVPFMLDLSHWFYHKNQMPWDLSASYDKPEYELIQYHKDNGVGFYLPNLGSFYTTEYMPEVKIDVNKQVVNGAPEITWRFETPKGVIKRTRIWEPQTYAWGIREWGVKSEADLAVFMSAMSRRCFEPCWDRYLAWIDAVGDQGVVYLPFGYSAMGQLLNYWMGIENVMYATMDYPDLLHEVIDTVNANNLDLIDLLCESPAEIILMGDNFSSDIQSPKFFVEWSDSFYSESIKRLHKAGKYVAVHIDGKLKGAIDMIKNVGADCADAVTPRPMGDLNAAECRAEAGDDFILSGGVSPDLWLPDVPLAKFEAKVLEWLEQKKNTSRFFANAGDQVPPGADEKRIGIMRDMVAEHGRY